MTLLQVPPTQSEIILNTPKRAEILKEGAPKNAKGNILGKGAYGTVFKAIFGVKQVAVKIVKNQGSANQQTALGEANILGWKHRNIVKIFMVETTPDFGIVIMEHFFGQCLQMILETVELPLHHRVYISLDILAALRYCHKHELLHLDVKPQNVLVNYIKSNDSCGDKEGGLHPKQRYYICKLCDFGSSLCLNGQKQPKSCARGTVRYMSPEALCEEPLTAAADIYSLGITMWQLQSREVPYSVLECNEAVAYQVVKHNLRPDARKTERDYKHNESKAFQVQKNCSCDQFFTESSYHFIEQIKTIAHFRQERSKTALATTKDHQRKLFHSMSRKRPLQETNAIGSAKCNLSSKFDWDYPARKRRCFSDLNGDDFNLQTLFSTQFHERNPIKEADYQKIYKSCWDSDYKKRPVTKELRKHLKALL